MSYDSPTKKYYLTEKGWLATEIIWDTRSLLSRSWIDLTSKPWRYVRRLGSKDHAILFYDTEDTKQRIVFPFLLAGLLKGSAAAYFVSENKIDSENQGIRNYGINLDSFKKDALTIKSANEWYLRKGKGEAKTIIANWLSLLTKKQKAGFTGLSVAGEMDVFFNHGKDKELVRYEKKLGKQLPSNLCGLCLYDDTRRLDERLFIKLITSHGHLIFKNIAAKIT